VAPSSSLDEGLATGHGALPWVLYPPKDFPCFRARNFCCRYSIFRDKKSVT